MSMSSSWRVTGDPEGRHRVEHHRLPDKTAPRGTLLNANKTYGTTLSRHATVKICRKHLDILNLTMVKGPCKAVGLAHPM